MAKDNSVLARVARANPEIVDERLGTTRQAAATLSRILQTPRQEADAAPHRRFGRTAGIATFATLVVAGAAAAAIDPFGLRSPNPGTAIFAVDQSRHVPTPRAQIITCDFTTGSTLMCLPAATGQRYQLIDTVHAPNTGAINRSNLHAAVTVALRNGQIAQTQADKIDNDLAAVPDSFLEQLRDVMRYRTFSAGVESGSAQRVPPPDVPALLVCEPESEVLACRDLNGDSSAPVGAGIYVALPESNWRAAPPQQADPTSQLISAELGHPLTQREARLVGDILRLSTATPGKSQSGQLPSSP